MSSFPDPRYQPSPPEAEGPPAGSGAAGGHPSSRYQPSGYQPPSSTPFRQYYGPASAAPGGANRRRGGILGGLLAILAAVWAYGKYVLLIVLKFKALTTLVTLAVSLGAYSLFFGFWGALGLVLMILLHEMGHVVEIRRQGMRATAPIFIPFLGAAIFQRQHPTDALKQAEIGIAGPIAGTIAATAAFVLYPVTHQPLFLFWAWIGFYINLFNLIPFGPLDGGWVLGAASKWFQVLGLVALAGAVFFLHAVFGPLLIILLLLGIPTLLERFRNDRLPYYQTVPVGARFAMGTAWLALVGYLSFASMQAFYLLNSAVR